MIVFCGVKRLPKIQHSTSNYKTQYCDKWAQNIFELLEYFSHLLQIIFYIFYKILFPLLVNTNVVLTLSFFF